MQVPILMKPPSQQYQTHNHMQSPSRSINSTLSESSSAHSITFKIDSEPQSPVKPTNCEVIYLKITSESPNGENTIQMQPHSPLSEVIDNQDEIISNNNSNTGDNGNNGNSINFKKSLKFKPSSVTNWRSRRRHSHITSPTIIEVNETKSRPTFNIPKATKRLSSNFIPKRFSSISSFNSLTSASQNTTEIDSLLSPPLIHEVTDHNRSTTVSENSSSSSSSILPLSSSPILPKRNERLDSISSSTPSEKSAITKSLTMFKRTTKSILFLDSSSPSLSQNSTPPTSKFSESVIDFSPTMPICRRSISCSNDDQLQQPILSLQDSHPYPNSNFSSEEILQSQVDFNEPDTESAAQSFDKIRKRSKTLNALENPLFDSKNNNNSGLLSSIANFVRINRSNPPATPRTTSSSTSIPSIRKKDTLSLIEGETPETYLNRIMTIYPLTSIATVLSIDDNDFLKSSFEYFMKRYFNFINDPLDIALRKFIMICDLPKETQQIDRVIYQFGKHFSEQHPELNMDTDTCYILTYSLIMVHTDRFNPNNKRKMTRYEYQENVLSTLKNNSGLKTDSNDLTELITKEVMGYYFDNIVHCPFIKISVDQSDLCLEALKSPGKPLPYPSALFLNSGEVPYEDDKSTTSCASSPSSSPVLQPQLQPQLQPLQPAVLRKRSSTFLWNSSLPMDPYEYIIQEKLEHLRLDLPFTCLNPFISTKVTLKPEESIYSVPSLCCVETELGKFVEDTPQKKSTEDILHALTSSHCSMALKVPKSKGSFLLTSKTEAKPINIPIKTANEYYITRIIKIGVISRQESKILSNAKTWKRYFCILTPVGLFFFKNVALFRMHYCGTEFNKKTIVLEEASTSSTTTNLLESFEPSFIISNESFATCMLKNLELDEIFNSQNIQDTNNLNSNQTTAISFLPPTSSKNLKNHTFFIYGRDTKNVYMVDNKYELKSWIDSINLISALSSVEMHVNLLDLGIFSSKTLSAQESDTTVNVSSSNVATGSNITSIMDKENKYYEVTPIRNTFLVDRIMKKTTNSENDSVLTLLEYLYSVRRLQHLVPLSVKTKEVLMSSGKILNVKLEWLWYEQCRTKAFINILKDIENNRLVVKKEDKAGLNGNDVFKDGFSCLIIES